MPQGTLKVSRKGKKREPYVVLHYKSADGKHRQKSLGRATEADILAIGGGVPVEFSWSENGKAEVADWPSPVGKDSEDETNWSHLPEPDEEAAQEECTAVHSAAVPVLPDADEPVDEAEQAVGDQAEEVEGSSQEEEEAFDEALERAAKRMMDLSRRSKLTM